MSNFSEKDNGFCPKISAGINLIGWGGLFLLMANANYLLVILLAVVAAIASFFIAKYRPRPRPPIFIPVLIGTVVMALVVNAFGISGKPKIQWTTKQKASFCKHYISGLMGRSTNIMSHYKTDESGQVYISYTRQLDGSLWQYVCSVDNNSIVWATYHNDIGEWGRWRNEDTAKLLIDADKKLVTIQARSFTKTVTL